MGNELFNFIRKALDNYRQRMYKSPAQILLWSLSNMFNLPSNSSALFHDLHLMRGVELKDKDAFSELFDLYSPYVYGLLLKSLPDPAVIDEVFEKVFLYIWKAPESYNPDKQRLPVWLYRITLQVMREQSVQTIGKMDDATNNLGRTYTSEARIA